MATIYIAIGGNLGDRAGLLARAVEQLSAAFGPVEMSSLYETEPVGYADQPQYLNAVVRAETYLDPHEILAILQRIELDLGRVRSFPHAPRTVDLDFLFCEDLVLDTDDLTLPHPRLHERFFVLVPMAEIAPDVTHPRLGKTVRELLDDLGPAQGVSRYEPE
jgi:2-amino-4-hydroxy-6-hydroxymethyldihydropteridine diphosphokinase